MSSLSLVVLAAGMGSRYGGLKQIDPVGPGGETVLDYAVFDALRAGFTVVDSATSPFPAGTFVALAAVDPAAHGRLIGDGLQWLAANANPDGGWGDTIRSRTQHLSFHLLGAEELEAHLRAERVSGRTDELRHDLRGEIREHVDEGDVSL